MKNTPETVMLLRFPAY